MNPHDASEDSFGRSDEMYDESYERPEHDATPEQSFEPRRLPPAYTGILQSLAAAPVRDRADLDAESVEKFKAIMAERAQQRALRHESFAVVPQFFFRKVQAAGS
jgi:hypothetical protein